MVQQVFQFTEQSRADELVKAYKEKVATIDSLEKDQRNIRKELVTLYAEHKVGDIVKTESKDQLYVIRSVWVDVWSIQHSDSKEITFRYDVSRIKKDGTPQKNHTYLSWDEKIIPTGDHIDL